MYHAAHYGKKIQTHDTGNPSPYMPLSPGAKVIQYCIGGSLLEVAAQVVELVSAKQKEVFVHSTSGTVRPNTSCYECL